jgi:hypothetical protein
MSTPKQPSLTAQAQDLLDKAGLHPDHLTNHRGIFIAKRSYFYRPKRSCYDWAQDYVKAGFVLVDHSDNWNAWPKLSYYEVRFTLPEPDADVK